MSNHCIYSLADYQPTSVQRASERLHTHRLEVPFTMLVLGSPASPHCLMLRACGKTQTVYVPAPVVPISFDLIADTSPPGMLVPFTWQASLVLNAQLYMALGQCIQDKAGIRKIESNRNELK
ncbi:Rz1-like lysis system protein LysC [Enterobacter hormaechei]